MNTLTFPLPLVESGQTYAPASLAREIVNLRVTDEGTLEAVRGPCPYIPDRGSGYPWGGRIHAVFHAVLDDGQRDVTLVRAGTELLELTGWTTNAGTGVRVLATGLSSDPNARFPDQIVQVGDLLVWNNGIDAPRIFDGWTLGRLGFDRAPGAPTTTGPGDSGHPVRRNDLGYSHPGKIGTIGNVYAQDSGALLAGIWYYYAQWEDEWGNRSPLSVASNGVVLRLEFTTGVYFADYSNYPTDFLGIGIPDLGLNSVNLNDLQKQLLAQDVQKGPSGTLRKILFRTRDATLNDTTPFELVVMDNETSVFPDNIADSNLGAAAVDYIPMPRFQAMCAHGGCLVVLDGNNVRRSDPGFIGSFRKESYAVIPGEPRGVFSSGGQLYAATDTTIYIIEDTPLGMAPKVVSDGFGLAGPNAVCTTGFGGAFGFGQDSAWVLPLNGKPENVSRPALQHMFKQLNATMIGHVWARWSPRDREVLVGVPVAGKSGNTRVLAFDGQGWRQRVYGMALACAALTQDWRQYMLVGARVEGVDILMALHGETDDYTAPEKTYAFRSAWLSADPMKLKRFNADYVYIGIVESVKADISVKVWINGTRDEPISTSTVENVNPGTTELFNTLKLGTGRVRAPRLTWKRIDVRVKSVESFAFDLTSTEPLHIAAFAMGTLSVDETLARVSRQ